MIKTVDVEHVGGVELRLEAKPHLAISQSSHSARGVQLRIRLSLQRHACSTKNLMTEHLIIEDKNPFSMLDALPPNLLPYPFRISLHRKNGDDVFPDCAHGVQFDPPLLSSTSLP